MHADRLRTGRQTRFPMLLLLLASPDSRPWPPRLRMTARLAYRSPVTATRKRKGRSKAAHVGQEARKRQRRAAFLLTTKGNPEAGTSPPQATDH